MMCKGLKFKKWTSFVLTFFMIFALITPVNVFAAEKTGDTVVIQVLGTSDTHGRFMPYDYATNAEDKSGSLAQIATAVKELRKANPNTLLVDAGDIIESNSEDLFLNGTNPMMIAMNEMGYDTITLGNHEFNKGVPTLKKVISQFKGTVLCGNVHTKDGSTLGQPYKIVEKAGVKIAIIGMTTPNITRWDGPRLTEYKVTSPIDETRKIIDQIKDKVDIMIAVNHTSDGKEYMDSDSAENLAKACPELTAVIGAHEHKAVDGKVFNGVLFVENKNNANTLAKIDIKLAKKNGKYTVENKEKDLTSKLLYMQDSKTKKANYEPDNALASKLKTYHETAIKDAETVIGELKDGDLVGPEKIKGIPTAQVEDTAMIDLINKVQMHYTGADVAAAACFRNDANMKQGQIKRCDAALIYKYSNTLELLEVTGKQLKQYMEWSASFYNTYKPGDLTVSFNPEIRGYNYDMFSGVKYEINISKEPGNRIVNLRKIDDTPIKDTDVLKLAVNNYRYDSQLSKAEGGIFKDGKLPKLLEKDVKNGTPIRELIKDYIENVQKGVITAEVDNNWKITGTAWDSYKRAIAAELINQDKLQLPKSEDGRTSNVKAVTVKDITGYDLITIAHTNDTHSRVKAGDFDGMGLAKISSEIKRLRENNKNILVLDAGDTFHGQTIATLNKGESIVKVLNAIGYDAMTPGNHDFNYGQDRLVELSKMAKFPVVSANVVKKNGETLLKPYTIKEINGVKFGIFGLATPDTATMTHPKNVEGLTFETPAKTAEKMVAELKGKCDVIVALTHLGVQGNTSSYKLAEKVKGIDLIVDGHSHTTLPTGTLINKTLVVQTGEYDKNLGEVNILFKNSKLESMRASLLTKQQAVSVPEDKSVLDVVAGIEKENEKITSVVIGKTDIKLDGERENVRTKETNLADLITNAMVDATGADVAITNGGGIRASIAKGTITKGDVITVLPFGNYLVLKEVKGSDILAALEHGVSDYPKTKGAFPQVAGITFKFDPKKEVGKKVFDVKINGKALDLNKTYKLATNDFLSAGGDGYTMLKDGKVLVEMPGLDEILINYIQKNGIKTVKVEQRIQVAENKTITSAPSKTPTKTPAKKTNKPAVKMPNNLYVVKRGDTLKKIGDKFGVKYIDIAKKNNIKNVNLIHVGQELIIPAN
ncbi:5'-nucleotidase C-terminal domain-containing protein [Clostridium sp. ZS2-4]|uniref:5'-nucleotidase C-terminal domain-containing protein n=1 Tax=Clostridium sp. ZS2-4 TaxID=2987703 RepID=UPI00227D1A32|nr:5'-nucleotidase C-terminal domain-containing protein [Clostridium sp. ZS2-4]MCY6356113.1 5'-nucleotidase C-terminal domain-containing protein [Clostridium sp. ZS2-4]